MIWPRVASSFIGLVVVAPSAVCCRLGVDTRFLKWVQTRSLRHYKTCKIVLNRVDAASLLASIFTCMYDYVHTYRYKYMQINIVGTDKSNDLDYFAK